MLVNELEHPIKLSHLNRIQQFLNGLMFVSKRNFEMLKRLLARTNQQPLLKKLNKLGIIASMFQESSSLGSCLRENMPIP